MTIGDILAVIAAIMTIAAGWGATVLLAALFFPQRTARARKALVERPKLSTARGAGLTLAGGFLAVALLNMPGPMKLVGGAVCALMAIVAAIGSAAIVTVVSERIQGMGTHMHPFHALTRGTTLYIASGLLPIVGWFFLAPVALILSVGAGWVGLRMPKKTVEAPPAAPFVPAGPVPGQTGSLGMAMMETQR
jgi:hypothetical protein